MKLVTLLSVLLLVIVGLAVALLITSSERYECVIVKKIEYGDGGRARIFFSNGYALNGNNVNLKVGDGVVLVTRRSSLPLLSRFVIGNAYTHPIDSVSADECAT